MTQKSLSWLEKNQQGVKMKQIIFFSNDNRGPDVYWSKVVKTQRQ